MVQAVAQNIMTRMVRSAPQQTLETPSIAAQLRVAVSRAASCIGLTIKPLSTSVREVQGAQLGQDISPEWLILPLAGAEGVTGFFALDRAVVTAIRDAQLCGSAGATLGDHRSFTAADRVLVAQFLGALRTELIEIDGAAGLSAMGSLAQIGLSPRSPGAMALAMAGGQVIIADVAVAMGDGAREGHLSFGCLQAQDTPEEENSLSREVWRDSLAHGVLDSVMPLQVVLGRLQVPLRTILDLAIGDIVPLNGVRIAGLRVEARNGELLCHARLGQAAGLRAVRLEAMSPPEIEPPQMSAALAVTSEETL